MNRITLPNWDMIVNGTIVVDHSKQRQRLMILEFRERKPLYSIDLKKSHLNMALTDCV